MSILVETDGRRRVSLAKLGVEADTYYLAEKRDDGTIVLVPADVRPKVFEVADRLVPGWDASDEPSGDARPSALWEQIKAEYAGD